MVGRLIAFVLTPHYIAASVTLDKPMRTAHVLFLMVAGMNPVETRATVSTMGPIISESPFFFELRITQKVVEFSY